MSGELREGRVDPSDVVSSVETAQLIITTFDGIKEQLVSSAAHSRRRDGKLRYLVSHPAFWEVKENSPEYEELVSNEFTSGVDIRYGEEGVSLALITRRLPRAETRRADWYARFMFPKPHIDLAGQDNGRRVVLDLWQTDYSIVDEASRSLSRDDARNFYRDFFKKQSNGIPAGAVGVQHFVFGRNEAISPGQYRMAKDILSYFQQASPTVAEAA